MRQRQVLGVALAVLALSAASIGTAAAIDGQSRAGGGIVGQQVLDVPTTTTKPTKDHDSKDPGKTKEPTKTKESDKDKD
ncbi:MAG TPA: hypothetical protein VJT49_30460, partial [Amycolatopsis sp.]|uniref:hypothetical protein n=1 Tax=Amycolatopsis sp. TaxID=37632 RepID=UPI002B4A51FE